MVNNNIERKIDAVRNLDHITIYTGNGEILFPTVNIANYAENDDKTGIDILTTDGKKYLFNNVGYEIVFNNQERLYE